MSLKDGIYYIDQMGFNAIDHTVINFSPLIMIMNLKARCTRILDILSLVLNQSFLQIKAWKNLHCSIRLSASVDTKQKFDGRKYIHTNFF